jgi:hypothetical protein
MKKNTSSQNRMDLIDRNYPNSTTRENWLKMHNHDSDIDHLIVIPETTEASFLVLLPVGAQQSKTPKSRNWLKLLGTVLP